MEEIMDERLKTICKKINETEPPAAVWSSSEGETLYTKTFTMNWEGEEQAYIMVIDREYYEKDLFTVDQAAFWALKIYKWLQQLDGKPDLIIKGVGGHRALEELAKEDT